jgi:hypothetical protein
LWARQDSNLQPTGYEPAALPLSYGPTLSLIEEERATGFEPATSSLEGRRSTGLSYARPSRGGRIRTDDPHVPNVVR